MGEDEAEFLRNKYAKIMADYCADAVWDKNGVGGYLDLLPVSPELAAALTAWQHEYDEQDAYDPRSDFDVAYHARRGRELARRVKAQLPDWTVMFFDESGPRHVEITGTKVRAPSQLGRAFDKLTHWLRRRRPDV